jgi:hypothetical protein
MRLERLRDAARAEELLREHPLDAWDLVLVLRPASERAERRKRLHRARGSLTRVRSIHAALASGVDLDVDKRERYLAALAEAVEVLKAEFDRLEALYL